MVTIGLTLSLYLAYVYHVADVIAFKCNGRCYCHIYIYIALTEYAYNSGKG